MSDTIISRWHPQDRTRTHTITEYKVENFLALDFLDFLDFLVFIFSSFDWKSFAHLVFTTDRLADFVLTRRRQLQQLESIVNQEIPLLTIFSCFVFILCLLFIFILLFLLLFIFISIFIPTCCNKQTIIYHLSWIWIAFNQEIPLLTILWMSFLTICFLVFIGAYLCIWHWSLPYWQAYCSGNVVTFQGRLRLRFFTAKELQIIKNAVVFSNLNYLQTSWNWIQLVHSGKQ